MYPGPPIRRYAPLAGLLTALLAAAALLGGCGGSQHTTAAGASGGAPQSGFAGAALPAGVRAPALTLIDQNGRRVVLGGPSSQVTVVSFLYTGCRACSLIAQQIRGALDRLRRPVRTLIVSVFPSESHAQIERFLRSVGLTGRVRWLIGPLAVLAEAWREYRVTTPGSGRAAYERAAPVLLLDRTGAERVLYQQEQLTPESLVADIEKLQGPAQGPAQGG